MFEIKINNINNRKGEKMGYGDYYKPKVGDILRDKITDAKYKIQKLIQTNWPGHGIYTLMSLENENNEFTVADFALYEKYEVVEES